MKLVTIASPSEVERTLNCLFNILPGKLRPRNNLVTENSRTLLMGINRKLQSDWIDHPAKTWHVPETTGTTRVFSCQEGSSIDILSGILIQNMQGIYSVLDFAQQ